jgi:hypothetical protein
MPPYLRVFGNISPDGTLKVQTSCLVQRSLEPARAAESRLWVYCTGDDGEDLQATALPIRPYAERSDWLAIRGYVPMAPGTRRFRFLFDGRPVHELPVAAAPPSVMRDWQAALPELRPHGKRRLTWQVGETALEPYAFWDYSLTAGQTWIPLTGRVDGTSVEIDFDQLPGGEGCQLALNVTDGVLVTRSESPVFALPIRPCVPMNLSPQEGSSLPDRASIWRSTPRSWRN